MRILVNEIDKSKLSNKRTAIDDIIAMNNETKQCSIMLTAGEQSIDEQGFVKKPLSTFIKGDLKTLQGLGLKAGDDISAKYGERVLVVKESTTPFWKNQLPKLNPTTDRALLKDGKPVYRNVILGHPGAKPEFVQHNGESTEDYNTFCKSLVAEVKVEKTAKVVTADTLA